MSTNIINEASWYFFYLRTKKKYGPLTLNAIWQFIIHEQIDIDDVYVLKLNDTKWSKLKEINEFESLRSLNSNDIEDHKSQIDENINDSEFIELTNPIIIILKNKNICLITNIVKISQNSIEVQNNFNEDSKMLEIFFRFPEEIKMHKFSGIIDKSTNKNRIEICNDKDKEILNSLITWNKKNTNSRAA